LLECADRLVDACCNQQVLISETSDHLIFNGHLFRELPQNNNDKYYVFFPPTGKDQF